MPYYRAQSAILYTGRNVEPFRAVMLKYNRPEPKNSNTMLAIDYIEVYFKDIDVDTIKNKIDFISETNTSTGEVYQDKEKSKYHSGEFVIKTTRERQKLLFYKGSFHKLYNHLKGIKAPNYDPKTDKDKGFNGNIFTLEQMQEIINHLQHLTGCAPENMQIKALELGANLQVSFYPKEYVRGLLLHNGKGFIFDYNYNYAECMHSKYIIKIYNKSHQYKLPKDTLRVEYKMLNTTELKKIEFLSLDQLTNEKLAFCMGYIIERIREIVYYDYSINEKEVSSRERKLLPKYANIQYWLNDIKPNKRDQHKKTLNNLIVKYSKNYQGEVIEKMEVVRVIFSDVPTQTKDKRRVIISDVTHEEKDKNEGNNFKSDNDSFRVILSPLNIPEIITPNSKNKEGDFFPNIDLEKVENFGRCKITNLPLYLENEKANYIQTKTLKYLREFNKEVYFWVCGELLPHTGKIPKFEGNIITHLAKQVRNRYFNQRKRA